MRRVESADSHLLRPERHRSSQRLVFVDVYDRIVLDESWMLLFSGRSWNQLLLSRSALDEVTLALFTHYYASAQSAKLAVTVVRNDNIV